MSTRCLLYLIAIVSSSCSFFLTGPTELKSDNFNYSFEKPGWDSIDPDTSDVAYLNSNTGSIILANSLCKKYQSSTLDYLSSNLLSGIENIKVVKKSNRQISDRDALEVIATGMLDGVSVKLKSLILQKNRCTYDFILIMPKQIISNDLAAFESFIKSVRLP